MHLYFCIWIVLIKSKKSCHCHFICLCLFFWLVRSCIINQKQTVIDWSCLVFVFVIVFFFWLEQAFTDLLGKITNLGIKFVTGRVSLFCHIVEIWAPLVQIIRLSLEFVCQEKYKIDQNWKLGKFFAFLVQIISLSLKNVVIKNLKFINTLKTVGKLIQGYFWDLHWLHFLPYRLHGKFSNKVNFWKKQQFWQFSL